MRVDFGIGDLDAQHARQARAAQRDRLPAAAGRPDVRPSSTGPALPPAIVSSSSVARSMRAARQLRIDAALEAVRGIGMQAQLARAAHDRRRREVRGLQEDVAGGVGDARVEAAHHAGHAPAPSARRRSARSPRRASPRGRRAASASRRRAAWRTTMSPCKRVVVERMHRLAQFEHHVLGDVDHAADRAQAGCDAGARPATAACARAASMPSMTRPR